MKKSSFVLFIGSIIGLIISLAYLGILYLLPHFAIKNYHAKSDAIGIIGSSDGPTAILITSSHGTSPFLFILIGICSIIGIIYYIYQWNKIKK